MDAQGRQARLRAGRGGGAPAVHRPALGADPRGRRQARGALRRPGPVDARVRGVHRGDLAGVPGQARLHLRGRRALGAPAVPRRGRGRDERQGEERAGPRPRADPVHRRGARDPQGRQPRAAHAGPARRRPRGPVGRAGRGPGDRLRAGLGDRHRRGRHSGGRAGALRRDPGPGRRAVRPGDGGRRAGAVRRLGEVRQRGGHHGRRPTSTAPWWAARAWTPRSSRRSCGTSRTRSVSDRRVAAGPSGAPGGPAARSPDRVRPIGTSSPILVRAPRWPSRSATGADPERETHP